MVSIAHVLSIGRARVLPISSLFVQPYLEDVCFYILAIDLSFGDTLLVYAHGRKVVVYLLVTLFASICHDTHHDLGPCALTPGL